MPSHIICKLPNASAMISGLAFKAHNDDGHMITVEPVGDDVAAGFDGIPGYEVVGAKAPKTPTPVPGPTVEVAPVVPAPASVLDPAAAVAAAAAAAAAPKVA